jgi:transcriptional repressor NF-X1
MLCDKVCRAMRNCGRHECMTKCCPLSYQEAIRAKQGRRRVAVVYDPESDPMGVHNCDRTCGRKLSCGQHLCERRDHKGPCPPCLLAGFEE